MRIDGQKVLIFLAIAGVLVLLVLRRNSRETGPMYTSADAVAMATDESFEKDVISQSGYVIVDFYAEWCGPCHMQANILKSLSGKLEDRGCKVVVVDVDQNERLSAKYGVSSIPRLLLFHGGKIEWDHVGVADSDEILAHIEK